MTIARAVSIIGSAKPAGTSTSESLGRYLFDRLAERHVGTKVLFVDRSPAAHAARELVTGVADANLLVLATPVYIDSLPYLVTRTLENLARSFSERRVPCAFAALINCGFPEVEQCRTAVAITRAFARRAGFDWAGGLALAQGGAIDGRPLGELGGLTRRVRDALDLAASALADGHPVPPAAIELLAHPLMPARVYTVMGNLGWRWRAAQNGVGRLLDATPFTLDTKG